MYQEKKDQVDQEISKALTYYPNVWWANERWRDDLKQYWKEQNKAVSTMASYAFDTYEGLDEDERAIMHEIDSHLDSHVVVIEDNADQDEDVSETKVMLKKLSELSAKEKKLFQIAVEEDKGKASQEDFALAKSLNEEIQGAIKTCSKRWVDRICTDMNRTHYSVFKANAEKDSLLEACFYGYAYSRPIENWIEAIVWDYSGHADNADPDDWHEDCSQEYYHLLSESSKIVKSLADDKCDCAAMIKRFSEFAKVFDKLDEDHRMRFFAKMLYKQYQAEYSNKEKNWYPSPKEISEVFVTEDSQKEPEAKTSFVFDEDELPF